MFPHYRPSYEYPFSHSYHPQFDPFFDPYFGLFVPPPVNPGFLCPYQTFQSTHQRASSSFVTAEVNERPDELKKSRKRKKPGPLFTKTQFITKGGVNEIKNVFPEFVFPMPVVIKTEKDIEVIERERKKSGEMSAGKEVVVAPRKEKKKSVKEKKKESVKQKKKYSVKLRIKMRESVKELKKRCKNLRVVVRELTKSQIASLTVPKLRVDPFPESNVFPIAFWSAKDLIRRVPGQVEGPILPGSAKPMKLRERVTVKTVPVIKDLVPSTKKAVKKVPNGTLNHENRYSLRPRGPIDAPPPKKDLRDPINAPPPKKDLRDPIDAAAPPKNDLEGPGDPGFSEIETIPVEDVSNIDIKASDEDPLGDAATPESEHEPTPIALTPEITESVMMSLEPSSPSIKPKINKVVKPKTSQEWVSVVDLTDPEHVKVEQVYVPPPESKRRVKKSRRNVDPLDTTVDDLKACAVAQLLKSAVLIIN